MTSADLFNAYDDDDKKCITPERQFYRFFKINTLMKVSMLNVNHSVQTNSFVYTMESFLYLVLN